MAALLQRLWYGDGRLAWLLLPLSLLFRAVSARRRRSQQKEAAAEALSVPVVVVGNISVGGTGKTPVLIALAEALRAHGLRTGIVSRGYGGRAPNYPFSVLKDSDPGHSGDEALLIRRLTSCPVVVDADRLRAARWLEAQGECDVVLSDDGLQHYRLPRTVEIAVIEGVRGLGNGLCLPAGPLREPPSRLREVDFVVVNGEPAPALQRLLDGLGTVHTVALQPGRLRRLTNGESLAPAQWRQGRRVHGVAGIGHPQRFFATLEQLGFEVVAHAFPDHHRFTAADIAFGDDLPVLMTAKDAVKCQSFASDRHWVLEVAVALPEALLTSLLARLQAAPVVYSR